MDRRRSDALSIPNLITYFRLILIPVFVVAYFGEHYAAALACLAVSALSDVADGYIARHFHMITNIGKVLDPVADKLTQAAMFFCLAWNIPAMWVLLAFLAVKELVMVTWGWIALRRTGQVNSAQWYGKVCTAVLYASMAALVLLPDLSPTGTSLIVGLCGAVMLMSLILYSLWYIRLLRDAPSLKEGRRLKETSVVRSSAPLAAALVVLAVLLANAALLFVYGKSLAAALLLLLAAAVAGVCVWLRLNRVEGEEPGEETENEHP